MNKIQAVIKTCYYINTKACYGLGKTSNNRHWKFYALNMHRTYLNTVYKIFKGISAKGDMQRLKLKKYQLSLLFLCSMHTHRIDDRQIDDRLLLFFIGSVMSCMMPWTTAHQASLFLTISQSLPKFMSIELVMSSNHPILCHPFLLLPSVLLSVRVFSSDLALGIRWPKYWCFSFSLSPSSEYSGLISFRTDGFDHLVVQGTLQNFIDR